MGHERAKLREKVCFGCGAMTYCVEMVLVLTYLMLYCSDVLKINVAVIGFVMAAVKVLDAVSDIVITTLADRTDTRFGKYRVWMLFGIPLGVLLVLLFSNPPFLKNDTARVIWICLIYCLMVPVMETAVSCPYMAMIVTMSEHSKDRLDFSNARALGEAGAQIIVSAIAMPLVLRFGGYQNPAGWRLMAIVIAAVIILSALVCFAGTKERIRIDYTLDTGRQMHLKEKMVPLKGNIPFWKLIAIIVLFMAHYYASSSIFTYFCIHNLGHEEWVSPLLTGGFVTQIIITVLLFYLGRKLEKRTLLIIGAVCIIAADLLLLFMESFPLGLTYQILLGVGNGMFNGMAFALLPDVTDYTECKTGVALPGMISAIATFAMKLGGAAATLLASRILVWAHYDASLAVQTEATKFVIRLSLPLFSGACIIAAVLLVLSLKRLFREDVEQYRKIIDARVYLMERYREDTNP